MTLWWLLAACGSGGPSVPDGLGDAGIVVRVVDGAFELRPASGGEALGRVDWSQLDIDPVDASHRELVDAMKGASGLWIDLPPALPWYRARKLLGSARTAEVEPVLLSVQGRDGTLRSGKEPEIGLKMTCREGPLEWFGVQPRITVALQSSREGSWAVANARFLPVVEGVPTDGLPSECLAPHQCEDWYTGADAEACGVGRAARFDGRVELGGPVGCLAPFLRSPDDLASWTAELPPVLKGLGLDGTEPVLVSPEARIRWDTVFTALDAFPRAGLPVPALGKPLVEGNDGYPLCTANVKDGAALSAAGARRAGTLLQAAAPPAEEDEG